MNRICPLPFEKDAARYYRMKGCIEACKDQVTESGTVFRSLPIIPSTRTKCNPGYDIGHRAAYVSREQMAYNVTQLQNLFK